MFTTCTVPVIGDNVAGAEVDSAGVTAGVVEAASGVSPPPHAASTATPVRRAIPSERIQKSLHAGE
jgi:hypothetical protein